ncbi:smalltalk protein [Prevotella sp. Sow4_E9_plate]
MKKETIKKVINFVITVLTAVLSAFCVQSCASL